MNSTGNESKTIFSGAAIVAIGLIISSITSFGLKLLVARHLSPPQYGRFALGRSLLVSLGIITVMGLNDGLGRYLPRSDSKSETRGYLMSALFVGVGTSLILATIAIVFSDEIAKILNQPNTGKMIRAFMIGLPGLTVVRLAVGGMQGNERAFPRIILDKISLPLTQIVMIAMGIATGASAWFFGLSISIGYLFAGLVGIAWLSRSTSLMDWKTAPSYQFRPLLAFSFPILLSGMMFQVLARMDVFLLSYFTGNSSVVGTYDVVYPLAFQITLLLTATGFITLPVLSRLDKNGDTQTMSEVYSLMTKWIFIATLPIACTFVAYPTTIIGNTFGTDYLSGSMALQVLVIGFVTHTVVGPNGDALKALGQPKYLLVCTVSVALLNSTLNVLLIPSMSMVGAALATTISYAAFNLCVGWMLHRIVGLRPLSKDAILIGLLGVPIFALIVFVTKSTDVNGLLAIMSTIVIFVPLYLAVILRYGLTDSELLLINEVENVLGRDLTTIKGTLKSFSR